MKKFKWVLRILLVGFIVLNISAVFHAYNFTHYSDDNSPRSRGDDLTIVEKSSMLFFGIDNPHPKNKSKPTVPYEVVVMDGGLGELEAWFIPVDSAKGTVLIFHGYTGFKSSMLERAMEIRSWGYNTFLLDFRGSGGSDGDYTTIGYEEAEDVQTAVDYLQTKGYKQLYLFGTSMGAASAIKALHDYSLEVEGAILECPFESMRQTVINRFEVMGVPSFPTADLLVFWGGVENGFWAYGHNPADYAQSVDIPTLLIYGQKDNRVKRFEIDHIYENLGGEKELLLFPEAAHDNFLQTDRERWRKGVKGFLNTY